jgi:hypothetical protein
MGNGTLADSVKRNNSGVEGKITAFPSTPKNKYKQSNTKIRIETENAMLRELPPAIEP